MLIPWNKLIFIHFYAYYGIWKYFSSGRRYFDITVIDNNNKKLLIKKSYTPINEWNRVHFSFLNNYLSGLISRQDAESLLSQAPPDSFMLRVSERLYGYALSHQSRDKCKHFLIDASCLNRYELLGTVQSPFSTLKDLIQHHKVSILNTFRWKGIICVDIKLFLL